MTKQLAKRRLTLLVVVLVLVGLWFVQDQSSEQLSPLSPGLQQEYFGERTAVETLGQLPVKGRAPKTGYSRSQFGSGWASLEGCSLRELILRRDLTSLKINEKCQVVSGQLSDPYTGRVIDFQRGPETSQAVQIDHVVALSDAWQKGAQQLTESRRVELANDPLNLLAVDGPANQQKGDSDAASWLPPNKAFRCQYVARQVAVKFKYQLWVTEPEFRAINQILTRC